MNTIEVGILISFVAIIILLLIFILKRSWAANELINKIESSLREHFLSFQSNIHNELNTTRVEISHSKDLITEHTLKTIETIKEIGSTINKIIQQQEESQKLAQSLKDILQTPKFRGTYSEVILEEMLENVLPKGIWETKYLIEGREQVDAAIRVKDIIIPIDAKFPRDNYLRYIEAPLPDEKNKYWKEYSSDVKKHIKSIKEKYIKPNKGTSDFALMFIPSESIYYETIAEKNYLGEPSEISKYAFENQVFPVSPNTFYVFLQVILMGLHNLEIRKNTRKLMEKLASLQKSFAQFYENYEKIGKKIEDAQDAYKTGCNHIDRYKKHLDSLLQMEEFENPQ